MDEDGRETLLCWPSKMMKPILEDLKRKMGDEIKMVKLMSTEIKVWLQFIRFKVYQPYRYLKMVN